MRSCFSVGSQSHRGIEGLEVLSEGRYSSALKLNSQLSHWIRIIMDEQETLIAVIQETIRQLERSNPPSTQAALVALGFQQCLKLQKLIEQMAQGYTRNKLLNQLKTTKARIQKLSLKKPSSTPSTHLQLIPSTSPSRSCRQQSQDYILNRLVQVQICQQDLQVSPEQVDKMLRNMQQLPEIMTMVNDIIDKNGEDLEVIKGNLEITLGNVKGANEELAVADRLQLRALMMKMRLGVGAILGAIGGKLFGVMGGVAGFVTGMVTWPK